MNKPPKEKPKTRMGSNSVYGREPVNWSGRFPKEKPKTSMGSNSAYGELDVLKMRLLTALIMSIIIGSLFAVVATAFHEPIEAPTEFDAYERVYSECIAHETITHEQCHDIALEAIRN